MTQKISKKQSSKRLASRQILLLLLAEICLYVTHASSSAESNRFPQPGLKPDPFVQASPLVCAVCCKDGVLVVAAHATVDEEPLVYFRDQQDDDDVASSSTTTNDFPFQDLPHDHQGPFRIQSIDTLGTCIVSSGWRADCERLVNKSQQIADKERNIYGDAPDASTLYVRYLSNEISSYLAQCAVSEQVRSGRMFRLTDSNADNRILTHVNFVVYQTRTLSCISLLLSPPCQKGSSLGQVWLVDATGAYQVRALAVGGGMDKGASVSDFVNQKLMERDWLSMNTKAAQETLLSILKDRSQTRSLPDKTRLEIGYLNWSAASGIRALTRQRLSSLSNTVL
jgi:hypothetical protein